MRFHDGGDDPVLAIKDADGNLVPDRRGPVFTVPDRVEVPEILRPHLDVWSEESGVDFPYRVEEALHFSNGSGVYRGRDMQGTQVVLREARPHAGLDRHGTSSSRSSSTARPCCAPSRPAAYPCSPARLATTQIAGPLARVLFLGCRLRCLSLLRRGDVGVVWCLLAIRVRSVPAPDSTRLTPRQVTAGFGLFGMNGICGRSSLCMVLG